MKRALAPGVLGDAAAQADILQIGIEVLGANPVGSGLVSGMEPAHQEIAQEELVPGDVPEEEGPPDREVAPLLGEKDEGPVPASGIEAPIEDLGDVANPGLTGGADEVFL